MNLQEWLAIDPGARKVGHLMFQNLRNRLVCKDGFTMSVQAGEMNYCTPRVNFPAHYFSVEVGYPDGPIPEFAEYSDGPDQTVFGYVPVELVQSVIDQHGGIMVAGQ